jgi:hypothetical protein
MTDTSIRINFHSNVLLLESTFKPLEQDVCAPSLISEWKAALTHITSIPHSHYRLLPAGKGRIWKD